MIALIFAVNPSVSLAADSSLCTGEPLAWCGEYYFIIKKPPRRAARGPLLQIGQILLQPGFQLGGGIR